MVYNYTNTAIIELRRKGYRKILIILEMEKRENMFITLI